MPLCTLARPYEGNTELMNRKYEARKEEGLCSGKNIHPMMYLYIAKGLFVPLLRFQITYIVTIDA